MNDNTCRVYLPRAQSLFWCFAPFQIRLQKVSWDFSYTNGHSIIILDLVDRNVVNEFVLQEHSGVHNWLAMC